MEIREHMGTRAHGMVRDAGTGTREPTIMRIPILQAHDARTLHGMAGSGRKEHAVKGHTDGTERGQTGLHS
jgi:hypothetical protein